MCIRDRARTVSRARRRSARLRTRACCVALRVFAQPFSAGMLQLPSVSGCSCSPCANDYTPRA
eukprot:4053453-Alexandrium_andersonii.AAC.1